MRFCENNNLGIKLYRDALDLAADAHQGQVDKSGNDYFEHPFRVSTPFIQSGDATAAIVSLLHDCVEDTWVTLGFLEDRFPDEIVDAVDALTRREDETYRQYIRKCIKNPLARRVKKQDILDNLRPERMFKDAPLERYYWALAAIRGKELEEEYGTEDEV